MISNADYPLIATPARTVSDVMPSDRRPASEPSRWNSTLIGNSRAKK
jgi:hypothetical protein